MFLALRELKYSKLKFGLLSFITFLIIFLVMFITGLANGLSNEVKSAISTSEIQSFILQKDSDKRITRSDLSTNDVKKITANHSVTPLNISQRTIEDSSSKKAKSDVAFFGIDTDSFLNPKIKTGKKLSNSSANGVVASDKLARLGYKVGDSFKETTSNSKFKIIGFIHDKSYAHSPVIFLNHKQLHKISPQKFSINTLVSKKKITSIPGYEVDQQNIIIQNIPGFKEEQGSLLMMIGFLYLISVVVLGVFFYIITLEKLSQLGTLKALGASTWQLAKSLLTQASIITIIALVISDILITIMSLSLPVSMPFTLGIKTLLGTNILFLVITVISTSVSLFKINNVDPLSAIGGN